MQDDPGDAALAVAVAQFAPGADVGANLATMRSLAETAVRRGARAIVFPEYSMYFVPRFGEHWTAAAESADGPFSAALAGLARDLGAAVVAGMVERVDGEERRISNTLLALDARGERLGVYRKLHLYDAFGEKESEWVVPGAIVDPVVVDIDGIRVGLQTCYDIRFPEVTRRLVDAGAELVVVPAEWVRGPLKETHWRTLLTARAIENTVWVAAADHAPPVGAGNSMILDPMGVEVATIGETTDAAIAWVSRQRIQQVRRVNPALALRRFGVVPR